MTIRSQVAWGAALGLVLVALPAAAAKWSHGCPSPRLRAYSSTLGGVLSPFAHPGHEVGIMLREAEVSRNGGFSTEPNGNTVLVQFASIFGNPVPLPPFDVTAVSATTLYFTFPDAEAVLGHPLAGPAEIHVLSDGRLTAHISPRTLVALPPSNDVSAIVNSGGEQEALATLDVRGHLWVPLTFASMGVEFMPMPGCDSEFIHKTAFAVGIDVRANGGQPGRALPPLRSIRRVDLYLGDFVTNGHNMYGTRLRGTRRVVRIPRGFGVSVCAMNDAVHLVMRARGRRRWARPGSGFEGLVTDSEPLAVHLADVSAEPAAHSTLGAIRFDTFGSACSVQ